MLRLKLSSPEEAQGEESGPQRGSEHKFGICVGLRECRESASGMRYNRTGANVPDTER
jgi:hypothetical protein